MTDLHPGFADPVRDSQSVFRAVMDAMARPGRIHRVAGPPAPPAPLARATAAVLLTLVDADTPLWLDASAAAAWNWVSFHCGAPPADPAAARFAVALTVIAGLDPALTVIAGLDPALTVIAGLDPATQDVHRRAFRLQRFSPGSDEEPEGSTTLILQVVALGSGETLRLSGPGLAGEAALVVAGLPNGFRAAWAENQRLFPRGIDVILCADDQIAALPRTVVIA